MAEIYGLIDSQVQILNQKGQFSVRVINQHKELIVDFQQDIHQTVVVASSKFFKDNL